MEKIKSDPEDIFFNTIKFVNDPQLWEKRKLIMKGWIDEDIKRKNFMQKHLSENFVNLFPSAEVQTFMYNTNMYCHFSHSSGNFLLRFYFSTYENQPESLFEFIVRIKNVETSPKILNKKELKDIFQRMLYCVGFQIGYMEAYIDRIDIEIATILNDRDTIIVKDTIFDVEKIFYERAYTIVKSIPEHYQILFQFENYIKDLILKEKKEKYPNNLNSVNQTEFYKFIEDITNYDYKRIKERHRAFKKRNLIPKF